MSDERDDGLWKSWKSTDCVPPSRRALFDAILEVDKQIWADTSVTPRPRYVMSHEHFERLQEIHAAQVGHPVTFNETDAWIGGGAGGDPEALRLLLASIGL